MPDFWRDDERVTAYFQMQGNKEYYVNTLLSYIASLRDTFSLWQREVITNHQLFNNELCLVDSTYPLDNFQTAIFEQVMSAMHARDRYYNNNDNNHFVMSEDKDDSTEHNVRIIEEEEMDIAINNDWQKFILITGGPGSGKSQIMKRTIEKCIEQSRNILVAAPTGILATRFKKLFTEHIHADTVHGAFTYPVGNERPKINWIISTYDIVIIDEISMIPKTIFDHIVRTLNEIPVRPIVLIAGDEQQQQPIENIGGKTTTVKSIRQKSIFPLVQPLQIKQST